MKILEILNFTTDRLRDPLWRERLAAPGLGECFCLLGAAGSEICIYDGESSILLQAEQMLLLSPGHRLRLAADSCPLSAPARPKRKNVAPGAAARKPDLAAPTKSMVEESVRNEESTEQVLNMAGGNGTGAKRVTAEQPATEGFVGAIFFKPDVSSALRHVLGLLQRQRGAFTRTRVREFFQHLYTQFAAHSVFSLQAANHALTSMLYQLAESAARDAPAGGESDYIERALELMNMRVHGTLNLAELTDELHLSEAHFIRQFKKKMQISPMKYFMRLKVHAAAAMIIQGGRIRDVAEQTGFYNDAHFSKQFKKYMGIPPREYKPHYVETLKTRHSENQKSLHFITHVLADFIDAIPDMVFFKDTFYVYRLCNTAFCDYVGRNKEDIYGHTDFTVFRPDIAAAYRYHDERVMRTLQAHANEEWVIYPDGRAHYVEAFKAPFFGPEQELLGMVAVCRDITERSDNPSPGSEAPHGRPKAR